MNNKKKLRLVFVGLLFSFFAGCNLSANEQKDFDFDARLVTEEGKEFYNKAGLEVYFANYNSKIVTKFQISFQIFDKDGMPLNDGIYEVVGETKQKEYCHVFLCLDEFFNTINPQECFVDYVFINKIFYKDGTEYSDPHGLKYFLTKGH